MSLHTYEDDVAYWRCRAENLLTHNIELKDTLNVLNKSHENLLQKFRTASSQRDIDSVLVEDRKGG